MATTVATLQSRIAALLGATVGDEDLSTADLLDDINQAYCFDIPDVLREGRFREQIEVSVAGAAAGRQDINSGTPLYGAILGTWARYKTDTETRSTDLSLYTSERDFWWAFDPANLTQSRPTSILVEGTVFTLRPVPPAAGKVYVDALKYRTALTQGGSITLDYEAKAIVYVAAGYAATRIGDDDTAARMNQLAGPVMDKLRSLQWRAASVPIIARNF